MSNQLVISFLFPPSDYVSGITVSKRIIERGEIVDVLQARPKDGLDSRFNECVGEYVDDRILVDIDCEVDWADCIFRFIDLGIGSIERDYESVYSRSWLMANHFLACEYKFKNTDAIWRAEFSDPLIYDLSNNVKSYKEMVIDDEDYIERVNNKITDFNRKNDSSYPLIENGTSAYFIAEYLVYLFADEIIFTNPNQREVMLNQFPIDIHDLASSKSKIKPHPTLEEKYYHLADSDLSLDDECVNIAYFGSDYYSKRNFEGLFYALEALNHKYKDKIRLYFFINDQKLIERLISTLSVKGNIIVKKPLEYMEFLNATTKFDVLVVNDVSTRGNYDMNPYLPSKLSDYLGSSADIWAMAENGSVLSRQVVKYKSDIDDFESCGYALAQILNDNGFADENYSFDDDYHVDRLTSLNELYEKEFRKNQKLKKQLKKLKKEKSNKRFKIF